MPVTGFSHFNLRAPRALLDTLCAFYRDVVGLEAGPRPASSRYGFWLYAGGRDVLHMSETSPGDVRAVDVSTTFDHIAFAATDLATVERVLAERGMAYRRIVDATSARVQLFFRDPAGNGVELSFDA
ncbi:VOC family protein [Burkholderia sp. FERM BP-3421]|uniref:VOC family protein n=1 Tax=Burkholderia sp. FERM BP-3421 TaxID=1494466 RepID=UPI00235E0A17|nr:VOC family protein [Burkholderia sp. FERM BP-3421]WDD92730.1 VOC family protein [Burkholderia sp. FERM BP-3421]